ncbi:hypothetical protein ONA91_06545 [Micromonospora sp. DR5-3]|uniref:hypothetical protein n=1 Tax=unclassified Micromonospora TaxID=2617518 RepID=UPI0011D30B49|nr:MULTISPECIES: hypothetical protein [unclassified Micromonospora]MCW3814114.1 hypothetical protein [Micromonospora sp. DR5-3]TYC25003.1 hypothetical protein FXF52_06725 [Micromonospora sp. MP36]
MSRLSPTTRKALLTLHLVTSLGWLGADLVLLTLGIAGLRGADPGVVYPAAGLLVTYLFAPLSVAVWLIGLVSALLTPWGLLRWRWVLVKFAISTGMLGLVLLLLTPTVRGLGELGPELATGDRLDLVIPPAVSSSLLILMTVLSTYKPWGRLRRARPATRRPAAGASDGFGARRGSPAGGAKAESRPPAELELPQTAGRRA